MSNKIVDLKKELDNARNVYLDVERKYKSSVINDLVAEANGFVDRCFVTKAGDKSSVWDRYLFVVDVDVDTGNCRCVVVESVGVYSIVQVLFFESGYFVGDCIEISKSVFFEQFDEVINVFNGLIKRGVVDGNKDKK